MRYTCACKDVGIWTYKNQIQLIVPKNITLYKNNPEKETRKNVCIDKCLEFEIKELWKLWIRTTGCCCGHNKLKPYIWVIDEDIQKMKDLWYKEAYNHNRPKDEDSFIPKTILCLNIK